MVSISRCYIFLDAGSTGNMSGTRKPLAGVDIDVFSPLREGTTFIYTFMYFITKKGGVSHRMSMKEDNASPKYFKGENHLCGTVQGFVLCDLTLSSSLYLKLLIFFRVRLVGSVW